MEGEEVDLKQIQRWKEGGKDKEKDSKREIEGH